MENDIKGSKYVFIMVQIVFERFCLRFNFFFFFDSLIPLYALEWVDSPIPKLSYFSFS